MPTAEKARTIEQAKEWYSKSVGVVFTDYRGLKVKEIQALRRDLRAKGGDIHVLKNTLFRIAAGDDTANISEDLHNGTTAVAFVYENEADVAKSLFDYARTNKKLIVKGGFFGGKSFTAKQVETLSQLPPRDVLIAQLIGTIVAPISQLVGTVEALYADPIRVIGAVADKAAEGSPVPVAAAEPPAPQAEEAQASSQEEGAPEAAEAEPPTSTPPSSEAQTSSQEEGAPEEEAATDIPADEPVETPADTNSTEAGGE